MTIESGPRERLAQVGPASLSDEELIALLLGTSPGGEGLAVFAARVLSEAGSLMALGRSDLEELATLKGIGAVKAARLVAAGELGRRMASAPLRRGSRISTSRDVDAALRPRLARAEREHFVALPLDAKNRPLGQLTIAVGGLSACPVAPSDVFRPLVRRAAAGVIFVHNHPSGEPTPSPDDIALTERLSAAGDLLGVRVVDHLIIGEPDYFSFLDAGLIAERRAA